MVKKSSPVAKDVSDHDVWVLVDSPMYGFREIIGVWPTEDEAVTGSTAYLKTTEHYKWRAKMGHPVQLSYDRTMHGFDELTGAGEHVIESFRMGVAKRGYDSK